MLTDNIRGEPFHKQAFLLVSLQFLQLFFSGFLDIFSDGRYFITETHASTFHFLENLEMS